MHPTYTVHPINPTKADVHHPELECEIRLGLLRDETAECATMQPGVTSIEVWGTAQRVVAARTHRERVTLQMCEECNIYRAGNAFQQR